MFEGETLLSRSLRGGVSDLLNVECSRCARSDRCSHDKRCAMTEASDTVVSDDSEVSEQSGVPDRRIVCPGRRPLQEGLKPRPNDSGVYNVTRLHFARNFNGNPQPLDTCGSVSAGRSPFAGRPDSWWGHPVGRAAVFSALSVHRYRLQAARTSDRDYGAWQ